MRRVCDEIREFASARSCRSWMAVVRTLPLTLGQMESHWKGLSRRLTLAPRLRIFHCGARAEAGQPVKRLQKFSGRCLSGTVERERW